MCSLERRDFYMLAMTTVTLFGFVSAQTVGSKDLFRCRQSCYQKFVQDWHHCMDLDDCKNMCITPPNINSYIPEAFSFLCWNNCDQQLGPFPLSINSAVRQGSLVITDIGWDQAITNASQQCLVTWEVSGGGLMGNLLTDSSTVELSLWSDTVYHVQVTCKHKDTGGMRRSYKLIVDTHKLGESSATGMQTIPLSTPFTKTLPYNGIYGSGSDGDGDGDDGDIRVNGLSDSSETDSRMRILKDSSKDFLTPYNPNAIIKNHYGPSEKQAISQSSTPTSTAATKSSGAMKNRILTVTTAVSPATVNDKVAADEDRNEILSTRFVQRSMVPASSVAEFFNATTLWLAIIGAVLLFSGLIALYCVLIRPAKKLVPVIVCPIDREILIKNELMPASANFLASSTTKAPNSNRSNKIDRLRSTLHV